MKVVTRLALGSKVVALLLVMSLGLVGCGDSDKKENKTTNAPKSIIESTAGDKSTSGIASQLNIKVTVLDEKDSKDNNRVVTMIENKSQSIVSGTVEVRLLDAAKNVVSSDTVFFEKLNAGSFTNATSWLKAKQVKTVEWSVKVKDATSVTADASSLNSIQSLPKDEKASSDLSTYLKTNFGGGYGQPTSWYKLIKTSNVYQENGKRIIVLTTGITTETNGSAGSIATAVMGFMIDPNNMPLNILRVDIYDSNNTRIVSRTNTKIK